MNFTLQLVIIIGKLCIGLLNLFGSSATALPGLIILRLYPRFLEETIGKHPEKIILITGTNGKTTTAHILTHLLRKSGHRVFHNAEGSNMERGIATEILKSIRVGNAYMRSLQFDFFVLESDEGTFPRLLDILKPHAVVLLNIFRDQLDRYGEINTLLTKWLTALKSALPKTIIYNADDPNITHVINELANFDDIYHRSYGFSVNFPMQIPEKNDDRIFCPACNGILTNGKNFKCETCGFKKEDADFVLTEIEMSASGKIHIPELRFNGESVGAPPMGKYNYYNLAAALTAFVVVARPSDEPLQKLLADFTPAFGRFEKILYKNKFFYLILAKNPAGMNNVLQTIFNDATNVDNLLLCLNDKIADGEDVSWIYDVDFENLFNVGVSHGKPLQIFFSGTRAFDLALRLKIAGKLTETCKIEPDMKHAFGNFLENLKNSKNSFVIVTYTCLLELQKIMFKKGIIKRIM